MTLLISHDDVQAAVTMDDAILAMESAFREEGEGHTILPHRTNTMLRHGWLRLGPAALERSGWAGFKAMNLTPGVGVRYQVHLYAIDSGELLAIMDAQHLTTLRTGASSVVATRRLANPGPAVTALLGSGPEARAQLLAMSAAGLVSQTRVYSPTPANREALAREFSESHAMQIVPVDSPEAAVKGASLILAAVKSGKPVLKGEWLEPGAHVNSVGSARPDQREIDVAVFERATAIAVDTRTGVFGEAGDAIDAAGVASDRAHELSALVAGDLTLRTSADDITLFKSVGTGIQDIAIAAVIYQNAKRMGRGTDLGEFPFLKRNK